MENENFANKNKDEINLYIKSKVESLTRQRVQEEIQSRQIELIEKQNELNRIQKDIFEKQNNLFKKEQEIEKQAVLINQKIKQEIDKHERDLENKQKELDKKKFELEREIDLKVREREKKLEIKEKEIQRKAEENDRKIQSEIIRREKELEEKRNLKDIKIPEIIHKAKDEVKRAQMELSAQQNELLKKQTELLHKQRELSEKEQKLKTQEKSEIKNYDENLYKKPKKIEENDESWLTTYSDVITLLLTMFVFLFSISQIDNKKMGEIQKAISVGLLKKSGESVIEKGNKGNAVFEAMKRKLQNLFEQNNIGDAVKVNMTDNGVKLELSNTAVYDPGSAEIKEEMKPILNKIKEILYNSSINDYKIIVEGHTDNTPINTPLYPSNWELSSNRATNIIKYLIELGINPNSLQASGYADAKPIMPNNDETGNPIPENQSRNRRVEIYIEKTK